MQVHDLISAFVAYDNEHPSLAELDTVLHQRADAGVHLFPHGRLLQQHKRFEHYKDAMRSTKHRAILAVPTQYGEAW